MINALLWVDVALFVAVVVVSIWSRFLGEVKRKAMEEMMRKMALQKKIREEVNQDAKSQ
jgi:hypothetical protein